MSIRDIVRQVKPVLEKNSIDLYAATKSLYLQNRSKKIKNETGADDDAWGDLDK